MNIDPNLLILAALIGFILIIGVIVGFIFGQLSRRSRNAPAEEAKKGTAQAGQRKQAGMRLARDPDTGRVIIDFQNRTIRDPRTLTKSEHDYLVRLAKDWSTWLGIPELQPEGKVEASLAVDPTPDIPGLAPAIEPVAPVPSLTARTPVPAPPAPRSIVQQVDDIVQEKLISYPVPVPTIHLVEDPYEGVIVWVNQKKFVGVESVTDPDVQAIIRSAAAEWEHRTEK